MNSLRNELRPAGLLSTVRFYHYLPRLVFETYLFAIRHTRNLKDLRALSFLSLAHFLYVLRFRGKMHSPFGRVLIRSREDIKSVAYGAFKTHFSFLKDLLKISPQKSFYPVLVDVGANIGDFSLSMAYSAGRVIAIEPDAENFDRLNFNIAENNLSNITALNVAAHDCEENITLEGRGSMTHVASSGNGGVVKGVPLDQIFDTLGTSQIDLLMLDVQGHEVRAIRGMANALGKKRVGLMIVETHQARGVRPSYVASIMKSFGYKLVKRDEYIFGQPHLYFRQ